MEKILSLPSIQKWYRVSLVEVKHDNEILDIDEITEDFRIAI